MTFAYPTSVTFTITSTGLHSQVGNASPAEFTTVAIHVGLRGLKGDKGDKGNTGDMHPDIPGAVAAAQDASSEAVSAASDATTKAGEASAARDIAVGAKDAAVAARIASEAARDEAKTFLPENYVPRVGGVALTGPLEVPANATGSQAVRASEAQWSASVAVPASGTAVDLTSIPDEVKEIRIGFGGIGLSAGNVIRIRLGTITEVKDSGYSALSSAITSVSGGVIGMSTVTDSFTIRNATIGSDVVVGVVELHRVGGNLWMAMGVLYGAHDARTIYIAGLINLYSESLKTLRFMTSAGGSFITGDFYISWRK